MNSATASRQKGGVWVEVRLQWKGGMQFEGRYVARGRGLTEEQVEKAVRLSQEKYCPIAAMLRPAVPITTEVVADRGHAAETTVA